MSNAAGRGLCAALLIVTASAAIAQVKISQVFGGAGPSAPTSTYTHDYVELLNTSENPVSLDGWAIQYTAGMSNLWLVAVLPNASIPAKHYYLVQLAGYGEGISALPTPDATPSNALAVSGSQGKLALTSTTVALTGYGPSPSSIVSDFVGYGTIANGFEGSAAAPTIPNVTTALRRIGGGETDTNQNAADFVLGPPAPRNTSSLPVTAAVEDALIY